MRAFAMSIRGLSARAKPNSSVVPRRVIDINLLPADRRPVDVAPVAVAVVVVLLLCMVAMVPLAFRVHGARADASSMEQQAAAAELPGGWLHDGRHRLPDAQPVPDPADGLHDPRVTQLAP